MKNLFFLIAIAISLSGCNAYESEFPLSSKPDKKIDTMLTGLWKLYYPDSIGFKDPNEHLIISPFNESEYLVVFENNKLDSSYNDMLPMRMYETILKGRRYFNVQHINPDGKGKYSFYVYDTHAPDCVEVKYLSGSYTDIEFENQKKFAKFFKSTTDTIDIHFQTYAMMTKIRQVDSVKSE